MSENTSMPTDNRQELIAENIRRKNKMREQKLELDRLNAKLAELEKANQELESTVAEFAEVFESLDPEALEADAQELEELRQWREQLGDDPTFTKLAEENENLRVQIREGSHRTKFEQLAEKAGFNPKALADAWEMSGYKAESDEVDESAIEAALTDLASRKPWMLTNAAETAPVPSTTEKGSVAATPKATAQVPTGGMASGAAPAGAKPFAIQNSQPGVGSGRGTPEVPGKPLVTVEDQINSLWAASGRSDPMKL